MTSPSSIHLHPRLIIEDVDAALDFYQRVFGATVKERFADPSGLVAHAAIEIGNSTISMAEHKPEWGLSKPDGNCAFLIHLTHPQPDEICERLVSNGGEVVIPIKDRPYGKREGRVRDPFGHFWVLSRPLG